MKKKEVKVDEATQREVYKIIDLMSEYIGVSLNIKKISCCAD